MKTTRFTLFAAFGCILFVLALLSLRDDAVAQQNTPTPCRVQTEYISSRLEQSWLDNAQQWFASTAAFCAAVGAPQQKKWAETWVQQLQEDRANKPVQFDPDVFSRFVATVSCPGKAPVHRTTFIEPLAHGLRHPNALCNMGADVMSRDYLLISQNRTAGSARTQKRTQNIYIDLGGTVWENADTAGQQWFARNYQARGITFDRMLLWEAKPITPPSRIYQELPVEYFHKYQYFNIPASPEDSAANPVRIMKTIATQDFKLDIDATTVESAFVKQLMDDPEAFALVDEFFFECQVNFEPMLQYWGQLTDMTKTNADVLRLFLEMRKRGWRAHSWV